MQPVGRDWGGVAGSGISARDHAVESTLFEGSNEDSVAEEFERWQEARRTRSALAPDLESCML